MSTTNPNSQAAAGDDPPLTSDPWTPDQESTLLKAVIAYKPVGLHAHFRMLAIRDALLQSGTIDPEAAHTRIPGIWAKLSTLYDLSRLDEREDAIFTSLDDIGSGKVGRGKGKERGRDGYWRDFELVGGDEGQGEGEGFEALMWERRLAPEGTPGGSDWDDNDGGGGGEHVATTDEARSSPVPSRGMRSGRKGRVNKLKDEMEVDSSPAGSSGRASRRTSKATSEVDEDQVVEDVDRGDDDEDEEEESEETSAEDEDDRRGSVVKRGRGGRRGRGKRGRRRG